MMKRMLLALLLVLVPSFAWAAYNPPSVPQEFTTTQTFQDGFTSNGASIITSVTTFTVPFWAGRISVDPDDPLTGGWLELQVPASANKGVYIFEGEYAADVAWFSNGTFANYFEDDLDVFGILGADGGLDVGTSLDINTADAEANFGFKVTGSQGLQVDLIKPNVGTNINLSPGAGGAVRFNWNGGASVSAFFFENTGWWRFDRPVSFSNNAGRILLGNLTSTEPNIGTTQVSWDGGVKTIIGGEPSGTPDSSDYYINWDEFKVTALGQIHFRNAVVAETSGSNDAFSALMSGTYNGRVIEALNTNGTATESVIWANSTGNNITVDAQTQGTSSSSIAVFAKSASNVNARALVAQHQGDATAIDVTQGDLDIALGDLNIDAGTINALDATFDIQGGNDFYIDASDAAAGSFIINGWGNDVRAQFNCGSEFNGTAQFANKIECSLYEPISANSIFKLTNSVGKFKFQTTTSLDALIIDNNTNGTAPRVDLGTVSTLYCDRNSSTRPMIFLNSTTSYNARMIAVQQLSSTMTEIPDDGDPGLHYALWAEPWRVHQGVEQQCERLCDGGFLDAGAWHWRENLQLRRWCRVVGERRRR
jgi:hypothetical protein